MKDGVCKPVQSPAVQAEGEMKYLAEYHCPHCGTALENEVEDWSKVVGEAETTPCVECGGKIGIWYKQYKDYRSFKVYAHKNITPIQNGK